MIRMVTVFRPEWRTQESQSKACKTGRIFQHERREASKYGDWERGDKTKIKNMIIAMVMMLIYA